MQATKTAVTWHTSYSSLYCSGGFCRVQTLHPMMDRSQHLVLLQEESRNSARSLSLSLSLFHMCTLLSLLLSFSLYSVRFTQRAAASVSVCLEVCLSPTAFLSLDLPVCLSCLHREHAANYAHPLMHIKCGYIKYS